MTTDHLNRTLARVRFAEFVYPHQDVSIAISIAKNSALKQNAQLLPVNRLLTFADMWHSAPNWMCLYANHTAAHFNSRHSVINYRMCMAGYARVCNTTWVGDHARAFHAAPVPLA